MKRTLLALAVAIGSIVTVGVATANSDVVVVSARDGQERLIHRGGTIRVGSSVYLHTNVAHADVGLTKIQLVNKCYLRVFFDTTVGEKVMSMVIDEDEALSKLGVRAGASGGNGFANIYFFRFDGKPVCANNPSLGPYANVWLDIEHLAADDARLTERAPAVSPPLEAQQKSVPSIARAPVTAPR
jgi:hypothetical protein